MDAVLYSKYHSLQKRDACEFLNLCAALLDWYDLSGELIMDLGCGPGNTSCKWLLTLFPEISKIIAIDFSKEMIEMAQVLYPNLKIEYFVADILDRYSLELWEGKISKLVSTWCFHYLNNQEEAFENIFRLLKPGGEAVLLFMVTSPYYDCYQDILCHTKWKEYIKGVDLMIPESHIKKLDSSHYQKMLEEVGFQVILCKEEKKTFEFETHDDCIGYCKAICPLLKSIPKQRHDEFENDFLDSFLKRIQTASSQRSIYHYSIIHVIVKKT